MIHVQTSEYEFDELNQKILALFVEETNHAHRNGKTVRELLKSINDQPRRHDSWYPRQPVVLERRETTRSGFMLHTPK